MEFGVLGQLEAWREGERLALGPIKQGRCWPSF